MDKYRRLIFFRVIFFGLFIPISLLKLLIAYRRKFQYTTIVGNTSACAESERNYRVSRKCRSCANKISASRRTSLPAARNRRMDARDGSWRQIKLYARRSTSTERLYTLGYKSQQRNPMQRDDVTLVKSHDRLPSRSRSVYYASVRRNWKSFPSVPERADLETESPFLRRGKVDRLGMRYRGSDPPLKLSLQY